MCSDRLLRILTCPCVNVIAVDSQNPGWSLSSLMSELGREVARNGPPGGRLCSSSYRPDSLLTTAEHSVRGTQHRHVVSSVQTTLCPLETLKEHFCTEKKKNP